MGNLGSNRTPDELRELFQTYGPVEGVKIVTDPETRYSRGFAFVEMTNDLEAKKAISHLNGVMVGASRFEWRSIAPSSQHRASCTAQSEVARKHLPHSLQVSLQVPTHLRALLPTSGPRA